MDTQRDPILILDWRGRRLLLDGAGARLVLGRGAVADLAVERPFVSRLHARIERRGATFVLVDASTNGTYVQTEDERVRLVRREELRLWGEGWIGLGEPPVRETALRFRLDRPGDHVT
jgi:adenylate cyclase